jgi:hypothetical protein
VLTEQLAEKIGKTQNIDKQESSVTVHHAKQSEYDNILAEHNDLSNSNSEKNQMNRV